MKHSARRSLLSGLLCFYYSSFHHLKVSIFVNGEQRAEGRFVGRRLCSRALSPPLEEHLNLSGDRREPNAEPLCLGSRDARDFWRGRLCRARLWDTGTAGASGVRPWMNKVPSASLVRAPPPRLFAVTVAPRVLGMGPCFRVHAPVLEEAAAVSPGSGGGDMRKAYYEVKKTCRSGLGSFWKAIAGADVSRFA